MEKYINILKNTPLFQGISEAEILPMLKCLSVSIKNYSKGEYLLRSGDKVQTIGMILSGQALIINDDVWKSQYYYRAIIRNALWRKLCLHQ